MLIHAGYFFLLLLSSVFMCDNDFSGTVLECQTVWVQVRTDRRSVGRDLGPYCLHSLTANSKETLLFWVSE